MFAYFAESEFMPCPECGASIAKANPEEHECEEQRRVEYQLLRMRNGINAFEVDFARYLGSPRGRFEAWYAERDRKAA